MGEHTSIEWTDATWNPTTGCTKISAGCDNCYAHVLAEIRLSEVYRKRKPVVDIAENRKNPFAVRLWPERLDQPRKWKEPRRIFVNSMSDVFHVDIPEDYQRKMFTVMIEASHHTYQVLTKRPSRAHRFWKRNSDLFNGGEIPAHIWIGTSIEDQRVIKRVDQLRQVPAATRFLSCEPLIGSIQVGLDGIHWVIVGGESGIGYRRMDPDHAREIRDQCLAAGVPFFFKQFGGRTPKAGGRLLDGRTWDEYPTVAEGVGV